MAKWRWKNFTPDELKCKGTGQHLPLNPQSIDALDKLQKMRDILGKPFVINSAYRSPEHNRRVGGARNSMHTQGRAFDIRIAGHDPEMLYRAAIQAGFTGIGFHTSFLHVDNGDKRQWEYGDNKARHLFVKDNVKLANDNIETEDTLLIEQQAEGYVAPPEPSKVKNVAIASGGLATGAGVIELAQHATPIASALSMLDWRVGLAALVIVAIGGVIWYRSKR